MKIFNKEGLLALLTLVATLVFQSCSNDDSTVKEEATEEDLAEIIASAVSEEDGGFAYDIDVLLEDVQENCEYSRNESFTDQESVGVRNFEINYSITAEVTCNEFEEFISLIYEYTSQRSAELIRLNVENSATSNWVFFENGDNYTLDGSYNYEGLETFKVRDENTISSTLIISSEDLLINSDGDLVSGILSVIHNSVSTSGDERSASGIITITSVNIGLLDVSTFDYLYEINFKTGEVTQIER